MTLRWQYSTPNDSHFLTNNGAEIVNNIDLALKNIPRGLKGTNTDYPILRVFASWPGWPKLHQTVPKSGDIQSTSGQHEGRISEDFLQTGIGQELGDDEAFWPSVVGPDPDSHPLATLHLSNFKTTNDLLDKNWFLGVVVPAKRMFLESDSEESFHESKRAKTDN
jgi:hypothetical protein